LDYLLRHAVLNSKYVSKLLIKLLCPHVSLRIRWPTAGLLDGNLTDVIDFGAGFVLTPDPTVVAYRTDLTITTIHGQLKASAVTTQSIITAQGAEWGQINPNTSTGRFAGATGMISVVFKAVGDPAVGPYETQITADICFAQ
jgi:hypothetical protein